MVLQEKNASNWIKHHLVLTIIALILGFLTIKGIAGAIMSGNPFSLRQIVLSAVSQNVKEDENGNTNILLLGIGGEGHDGSNLTDTIIIASIDKDNNSISMLSTPRDLYVNNLEVGWGSRINGVYQFILDKNEDKDEAMRVLIEQIQDIYGIKIQYFAKVDFKGFVDVVDALGGVEVSPTESLIDQFYPGPDGSSQMYDPLYIKAGTQTLDGATALKYARSRETSSDFERAKRQQEIIVAMKDKALSAGFLLNPVKIKNLYSAISSNFETNMTTAEMIYLAKISEQFDRSSILQQVISDEAYKSAGFVYGPDRNLYGGAAVLIPTYGDFTEFKDFAKLFLFNQEIFIQQTPITVLNGTSTEGLAVDVKLYLKRYGFNVVDHGNAPEKGIAQTTIQSDEDTYELLNDLLPGERLDQVEENPGIVITLGEDFLEFYTDNSAKFYASYFYQ